MDWTTVTSVAITGAVGIAGVVGTIVAAKIAGNAEDDRARLADKRQVYARAVATLDAAMIAAAYDYRPPHDPSSDNGADSFAADSLAATRAAYEAKTVLLLIAPPPLTHLAEQAMSSMIAYRQGKLDSEAAIKARGALFSALRADLDEEARRTG